MARLERFEDIEAWKKARELSRSVYQTTATEEFGRDFGLRDQLRMLLLTGRTSTRTNSRNSLNKRCRLAG
jgi:23S rRNA-intervening sequence protein